MFVIRPATFADRTTIRQVIFKAGLFPFRMNWRRFLVVEASGSIVGVGQVRAHGDGSLEVASIAVVPTWQGKGVGSALVRALVERESSDLYLFCLEKREGFYSRLGFLRCEPHQLPPSLARIHRVVNWLGSRVARMRKQGFSLLAMKRTILS